MRPLPALLGVLLAGIAVQPCAAQTVVPFVDCVDFDPAGDAVTAWFSYANGTGDLVFVPLGVDNYFDPLPAGRGQPTTFATGVVRKVFSVTFPAASVLTWNLQGNVAVASNDPFSYCYHEDIFRDGFEP